MFDNNGNYLAEEHWLGDSNSSAVQSLDVARFVSNLEQSNPAPSAATQYFVRFRIDPYGQTGAGFTFTEMDAVAVPEPATGLLLLGALPFLWAFRRGRNS